jgi:hypothetical protein
MCKFNEINSYCKCETYLYIRKINNMKECNLFANGKFRRPKCKYVLLKNISIKKIHVNAQNFKKLITSVIFSIIAIKFALVGEKYQ